MNDENETMTQDNTDDQEVVEIVHPDAKWYVVHTLTGQELKVQNYIENTVVDKGLQDFIFQVLVPMEDVIEMYHGKRRTVQRKFFPGYIVVQMLFDKNTESFISGVPGVTGFIRSAGKAVPLSPDEIESIMNKIEKEKVSQKVEIPFVEGEPVRVVDGPFKDFTGIVSEINHERGKIRVMVSIFGRLTPVDVDFMQLKPDKK